MGRRKVAPDPLAVVLEKIEARQEEIARLDETIAAERVKEDRAIRDACLTPGDQPYFRGRPAYVAREAARKAAERKGECEVELVALAQKKGELEAGRSAEVLRERAAEFGPLREEIGSAWAEVAERFAALVGPWERLSSACRAHDALRVSVESSGALADANDPAAVEAWREAAAQPFTPVPRDFGQLLAIAVRGCFGKNYEGSVALRGPLNALFPDLTAANTPLQVSMDTSRAPFDAVGFLARLADQEQQRQAAAAPPVPEPPTPDDEAREAARVARVEAEFAARAKTSAWQKRNGNLTPEPVPYVPPADEPEGAGVQEYDADDVLFTAAARRDLAAQGLL